MPTTRTDRSNRDSDKAAPARRVAAFAAIGVAIVAAVMMARGCGVEQPKTAANTGKTADSPSPSAAPSVAVGQTGAAPAVDEATLQKLTSIARLEQMLSDYKANAIYPPWSRIHDEGTRYKLEWNKPAVSDLPLSTKADRPTNYRFASDKAHVTYGESITSWIEAWEGDDETKRVPLKVSQAFVMSISGDTEGRLIPLEYKDDGKLRYTNTFTPSNMPELAKAQQVRLSAVIEQGDAKRLIVREFTYAPRKLLTVTGVSDALKEGNLTVLLDVDVIEKGTYSFEANIMSADGATPIGWFSEDRTLAAGKQTVECRVLGKVFTDKGIDGPYLVKDIRGMLRFLDSNDVPIWWKYEGTHLTKAYKTVDFSSKEWDAPEKREKIAGMEKMIGDTKAGKIGVPVEKAKHIHIDENGKVTEVE